MNRFYGVSDLWTNPELSVIVTPRRLQDERTIALAESNESAEDWSISSDVIEDVDRALGYNLLNADAVHSGIEWDFTYTSKLNIQGVFSAGNWRWTSNERVDLINRNTDSFITRTGSGAVADTGQPQRGESGHAASVQCRLQ